MGPSYLNRKGRGHRQSRGRGRVLALVLAVLVGLPATAWAAMAVLDSAAVAKLSSQLNKLQEQISAIIAVKDKVQEQIDAIGAVGKITLPTINLDKLGSQLQRDLQCLVPDFSNLMPELNFEELDIGNICEGSALYRDTLWLDPEDIAEKTTWGEQTAARKAVEARRERIFIDTVTKAMAHADMATKDIEETASMTNELEGNVKSATDSRTSLQAIGQGQVAILRTLAKQNQLLAQLLKVQAVFALKSGVPVEGLPGNDDKKSGGKP